MRYYDIIKAHKIKNLESKFKSPDDWDLGINEAEELAPVRYQNLGLFRDGQIITKNRNYTTIDEIDTKFVTSKKQTQNNFVYYGKESLYVGNGENDIN